MTRALLIGYGLMLASLTTAIPLAVLVGSLRSQPAALTGLDDCQLPCWNKITPEQTTWERASRLLSHAGYQVETMNHHWRYMTYRPTDPAACRATITYEATVFLTELIECTGVSLGDVMAILGPPQGIVPSVPFDSFIFRDGAVAVITRRPRCETDFSLYTEVTSIRLRARLDSPLETEQLSTVNPLPWRGLIPLWRYDKQRRLLTNC
jgi:hypothetical protein